MNPRSNQAVPYSAATHRTLLQTAAGRLSAPGRGCTAVGHELCTADCAGYHHGWIALQALGLISGLASERAALVADLHTLPGESRPSRVLIAGSADFGLLSVLHEAWGADIGAVEVTVADRCATPLALCEEYAQQAGFKIRTCQTDLLDLEVEARFDLVVGHSILSFFDAERRACLLARLVQALAPAGMLLLYQSIRPGPEAAVLAYSTAERCALAAEVVALVETDPRFAGIFAPSRAAELANAFCGAKTTFSVASIESIAGPLAALDLQTRSRRLFDATQTAHRTATPAGHYEKYGFLATRLPA